MLETYREITFEYDGANRLVAEHYRDDTGGTPSDMGGNHDVTYAYDAADNRTSKTVQYLTDPDAGPDDSETFSYNSLNQLTSLAISKPARFGQPAVSETINYTYDLNGNRITRDDGTVSTVYACDYDQRLIAVSSPDEPTYFYLYDYRTRRVGIATDIGGSVTNTVLCFSGGTSVQEWDDGTLTVEYVRGSDLGGGIGGILYTIRDSAPSYTHYNGRGDVVAKTDASNALTYQATYDAFGTRPEETGSTEDRQKANTKDEDPTGLLNEGFRYRDLEANVFITRDPIGFKDGPNLYTYVHQNPWTHIDPEGLETPLLDHTSFKNPYPKTNFARNVAVAVAGAATGAARSFASIDESIAGAMRDPVARAQRQEAAGRERAGAANLEHLIGGNPHSGAAVATQVGMILAPGVKALHAVGVENEIGAFNSWNKAASQLVTPAQTAANISRQTISRQLSEPAQAGKGGTLYGPYHRVESPTQTAEVAHQIEQSGELLGRPRRGSDIPQVKAYQGPLPSDRRGIEFTTPVKPDKGVTPGDARWTGPRPGVKVEGDFAKIPVKVHKNKQKLDE